MKRKKIITAGDISNGSYRIEGGTRDRHRVYYSKGICPTILGNHKNLLRVLIIYEEIRTDNKGR